MAKTASVPILNLTRFAPRSRNLGVFFDVENIFEVPLDKLYAAYPGRWTTWRIFHAKITGGITGRF